MSSFSIKWLLLAVAYVAVSVTAFLNANDYWHNGFESAAILLLLTAILGTIFRVGQPRAFWTGWLVFGAAWFFMAFGIFERSRLWMERLVTTPVLDTLHERMFSPTTEMLTLDEYEASQDRFRGLGARITPKNKQLSITYVRPSQPNFTNVGNAALGIPFALLGSIIATWFWRRREAGFDGKSP